MNEKKIEYATANAIQTINSNIEVYFFQKTRIWNDLIDSIKRWFNLLDQDDWKRITLKFYKFSCFVWRFVRTWSLIFRNFSTINQRSDQKVFYVKSIANCYKNKRKIQSIKSSWWERGHVENQNIFINLMWRICLQWRIAFPDPGPTDPWWGPPSADRRLAVTEECGHNVFESTTRIKVIDHISVSFESKDMLWNSFSVSKSVVNRVWKILTSFAFIKSRSFESQYTISLKYVDVVSWLKGLKLDLLSRSVKSVQSLQTAKDWKMFQMQLSEKQLYIVCRVTRVSDWVKSNKTADIIVEFVLAVNSVFVINTL